MFDQDESTSDELRSVWSRSNLYASWRTFFTIVFTLTQVNWHYSRCCSNLLDNETQGYCLFCFATWVYFQGNLELERKLVSPLGHCIIVKRPSFNSLLSLFFSVFSCFFSFHFFFFPLFCFAFHKVLRQFWQFATQNKQTHYIFYLVLEQK